MGNQASTAQGETEVSGVTLSPKLQQKIVQEFQARVQAEWLQRSEHIKEQQQANSETAKEHQKFLKQSETNQAKLEQRFDELSATFHDQMISTNYDASALHEKYVNTGEILGQESPCSEVRNNYSSCQQKNPKEGCAIYIQALEDCISKAISTKDYNY